MKANAQQEKNNNLSLSQDQVQRKPESGEYLHRSPEVAELQLKANESPRVQGLMELQQKANNSPYVKRKKENGVGAFVQRKQQSFLDKMGIHAKLKVSNPGDKSEKEADAIADKVMRMSDIDDKNEPNTEEVLNETEELQTKPMNSTTSVISREQDEEEPGVEEEEEETISAKRETAYRKEGVSASTESKINNLGGGRPLSSNERSFFEPKFGADFSGVRVHNDSRANQAAGEINAKAFAKGNNVVFAKGEYSPGSEGGKKLMAHELAHVVQSTGQSVFRQAKTIVETPATLAKKMREAFRGLGTDEDEVYRILSFPPKKVREMINYYNDNYNDHTGKGIFEDLKDELTEEELKRAANLLKAANIDSNITYRVTDLTKKKTSDPNKVWIGLIVRGQHSEAHEPGVMEQHADAITTDTTGKMNTVGFFGDAGGPGVSGSHKSDSIGLGLKGVSADMAWFLKNRLAYVDLHLAIMQNVMSSLILIEVTKKQAADFSKYWDDLKKDPGTFNFLGGNCSTAAAAGFEKASVTKEINGLDTPDNLFNQLKKEYPKAFMISGHVGYIRAGRKWQVVANKLQLVNPGSGNWIGPYIAQRRLKI